MKSKVTVSKQLKDGQEEVEQARQDSLPAVWVGLRNILSVAMIELRLQMRSFTLWMLLLLNIILLYLEIHLVFHLRSYWNFSNFAIAMSTGGTNYILLTIPFLFMATFMRDQRRRMQPLLWVRPLSTLEYTLGKGLAVAVISSFVEAIPLFAAWGITSWQAGSLVPWLPWLQIGSLLLISAIGMGWLALLMICLLGPLPGALVCTIVPIFVFFQRNFSLLNILNFAMTDIYYLQSNAFGPDTTLLKTQRLFYLILAGLFLVLTAVILRFRERKSWIPRRQLIVTCCSIGVLIVALGGTLINFFQVGQQYQDISQAPVSPSTARFSHYSLTATVDPSQGLIDGTAYFQLSTNETHETDFYLALQPSLSIQRVTMSEQATQDIQKVLFTKNIQSTSTSGWTKLTIPSGGTSQNNAIWLKVQYRGIYMVSRDDYSDAKWGMLPGTSDQNTLTSYIGNGMSFLGGNGGSSWYPLPWTQQVSQYGDRLPIDEAKVTFPSSVTVVSSLTAPQKTADGKWQTVTVHPQGVLPLAFIGAMTTPQTTNIDQMPLLYTGLTPDTTRLRSYNAIISQTIAMEEWLHNDTQVSHHWHAMVMPFLNQPIIGSGLVLLPEYPLISTTGLNLDNQVILTRFAGGEVALSWWRNSLRGDASILKVDPTSQQPQGTVRFSTGGQTLEALASYSAAVTTDHLLEHNFFSQEEKACSAATSGNAPELGIEECVSQARALYQLRDQYGTTKVTQILHAFAQQDTQQEATWSQFASVANSVMQRDITANLIPYVCDTTKPGTSNGGKNSSGNCLATAAAPGVSDQANTFSSSGELTLAQGADR